MILDIGIDTFAGTIRPQSDETMDCWFFTEEGFHSWLKRVPEAKKLVEALRFDGVGVRRSELSKEIIHLINSLPEDGRDHDVVRARWIKKTTKLALEQLSDPEIKFN